MEQWLLIAQGEIIVMLCLYVCLCGFMYSADADGRGRKRTDADRRGRKRTDADGRGRTRTDADGRGRRRTF